MYRKNITALSAIFKIWLNGMSMQDSNKVGVSGSFLAWARFTHVKSLIFVLCCFIALPLSASAQPDIQNAPSTLGVTGRTAEGTFTLNWAIPTRVYNAERLVAHPSVWQHSIAAFVEFKAASGAWTRIASGNQTSYALRDLDDGVYQYRRRIDYRLHSPTSTGYPSYGGSTLPTPQPIAFTVFEAPKSIRVYPPSVPKNLKVEPIVSGAFNVTWDRSTGNVKNYELQEQKIGSGGYGFRSFPKQTTTSYSPNHTSNELKYRVRACRIRRCSAWSNIVTTRAIQTPTSIEKSTIGEPGSKAGSPTHLKPYFSNGGYDVVFGGSVNHVEAELSYFLVQELYNHNPVGGLVRIDEKTLETEPYYRLEYRNKAPGEYDYQIRACNVLDLCGEAFSATFPVTVLAVPPPPTSVVAQPKDSDGAITLKWNESAGLMVNYYNILQLETKKSGAIETDGPYNTDDLPLLIRKPTLIGSIAFTRHPGEFTYKVQACSYISGCGDYSVLSNKLTVHPPGAPKWARAVSGDEFSVEGEAVFGDTDGNYTMQWDAVPEIPGINVVYHLTEHNHNTGVESRTTVSTVRKVNPNGSTSDRSVAALSKDLRVVEELFSNKAQGLYTYSAQACMSSGKCGSHTEEMSVHVTYRPASAPNGFQGAVASDGSTISLSWNAVENADFYELDQKNGNGEWAQIEGENNQTSQQVSHELTKLSAYSYRVRACNTSPLANEVKYCSGNSDVLQFTLKPVYVIDEPLAPTAATIPAVSGGGDTIGTIEGRFKVGQSGEASYDVSIATATGTAGVVPKLNLMYSSQRGNGLVGTGWSIGGLSSVRRCRQTLMQDGQMMPISWGAGDRFCLDGQRLLVQGGVTYGSVGSTYKTEVDSFASVRAHGGSLGSPNYFTVVRKDGSTSTYGVSANSKHSFGSGVLTWGLNDVKDSIGNKITFTYFNDSDGFRISQIGYAYGSGSTPNATVNYDYEDRADDLISYISGEKIVVGKRLSAVRSNGDGQMLRSYTLAYRPSSELNKISRLATLQECTSGNICLPKTRFDWRLPSLGDTSSNEALFSTSLDLGDDRENDYLLDTQFADINGDGLLDIVYVSSNIKVKKRFLSKPKTKSFQRLSYLINNGQGGSVRGKSGYDIGQTWRYDDGFEKQLIVKPFDYNLDGRQDLLVKSEGLGWHLFLSEYASGSWTLSRKLISLPFTGDDVEFADMTGDGLADAFDGTQYWAFERDTNQASSSNLAYRFNSAAKTVTYPGSFNWNDANLAEGIEEDRRYFDRNSISVKAPAGDVNGDGLGDFLVQQNGYQVAFSQLVDGQLRLEPASDTPSISDHTVTRFADINADGLSDIVYWSNTNKMWLVSLSKGTGFNSVVLLSDIRANNADDAEDQNVTLVDANNDGFIDILWENATEFRVRHWLGAEERFGASELLRYTPVPHEVVSYNHIFTDYTGDGIADYIQFTSLASISSASLSFYPADGDTAPNASKNLGNVISSITNGFGAKTSISYERLNQSGAYTALPDGNYSSLNDPFGSLPSGSQTLQQKPRTPVLEFTSALPIVTRVGSSSPSIDSDSNMSSIRYHYGEAKVQAGGRGNLGFKYLTATDGQTGIRTRTTYRQDWPFIGYPLKTEVRTSSGKFLSQSSSTWRLQGWNSAWINTVRDSGTAAIGAVQPILSVSVDDGYSLSQNGTAQGAQLSRVKTSSTYDDFGNLTQSVVTTDGYDVNYAFSRVSEQTTVNTFGASSYDKRMGRLSRAIVTSSRPGTADVSRTSSFSYYESSNLKGLLKTETVQPDSGKQDQTLTSLHLYDAFGNKEQVKTTGWDGVANITRLGARTVFDNLGRYPLRTYQDFPGLGEIKLTEVVKRDKYGKPTEIIDLNGNKAYTAYTPMGREYFATSDSGGWTRISLSGSASLCPSGTASAVSTSSADGGRGTQCFDILGRSIRTLGIVLNDQTGFDWVATDVKYDNLGRIAKQSTPFTITSSYQQGAYQSYFEYDLVGNTIKTSTPGGDLPYGSSSYLVDTTVSYSNYSTTTVNSKNQSKTEIRNALGEVVRVTDDDNAQTNYFYDASGNLIRMVDAHDNISTLVYDELGRKTSIDDPDKGSWEYHYNAFGELVLQTDAKNQSIQTIYDALGREKRRIDIDGLDCIVNITEWLYDTQTNGIGLLARERSSDGYQQTPSYDRFGRATRNLMIIPGAGTFETAQTYDHLGRVFQAFDASSKSNTPGVGGDETNGVRGVQTIYDEYGFVKETHDVRKHLSGASFGYYQRNERMDERGNLTKYVLGNGLKVTKKYYSPTGLLHQVQAQRPSPSNTLIQNLLYYWDDLGNLTGRTTTGEQGDTLETFIYDNLNRLEQNSVGYLLEREVVDVSYDLLGNIKYKSDVGVYKYGENGAGPHAVTSAGDDKYRYDNNGNNYYGDGRVLKYNAFDKVEEVNKGGYTTTFKYSPSRSRYQRNDVDVGGGSRAASAKTTYYIGNVEYILHTQGERAGEREYKRHLGVAVETILYGADGNFVSDQQHFLLHDHLGSVERITSEFLGPDDNVELIQKLSYDPWGQRRDTDSLASLNGQALASFDSSITTRGFTGHEMVDGVGIIHMNGRIYDAKLGRFLQADPFIQDPLDGQNLNRYSYLRNNPLNATDPSGYFAVTAAGVAKFVGVAVSTYVVTDLLITLGFDKIAQFAALASCASSAGASCVAAAAAGSTYAFTYDFKASARAAGQAYASWGLGKITSGVGKAGSLENSIANGIAGGIVEELGGGNFGNGFASAGLSAFAKPYINRIGGGEVSHRGHRVAARAVLGGTISELTGGKFANGAISAGYSQLFNAETVIAAENNSKSGFQMSDSDRDAIESALSLLGENSLTGASLINTLKDSGITIILRDSFIDDFMLYFETDFGTSNYNPKTRVINYFPSQGRSKFGVPNEIVLGHELVHAYQDIVLGYNYRTVARPRTTLQSFSVYGVPGRNGVSLNGLTYPNHSENQIRSDYGIPARKL